MAKYLMRSVASTSGWQASPALVCRVKCPAERQEWEHLKLLAQTLVGRGCLDMWIVDVEAEVDYRQKMAQTLYRPFEVSAVYL